ncbi:MAG TPA: phage late control D family protein [Sphingopyxis sp.]|nr:phage late control D family protein [Sphingopyxis sp.]
MNAPWWERAATAAAADAANPAPESQANISAGTTSASARQMPIAAWRVTLNGLDLTSAMAPRLISLSISEKRGDEADQLDIVLHDVDGALDIPPKGAVLRVHLGWRQGSALPVGLIDKGSFKVDEASWRGPPDQITIRARSADMTDGFRVRQDRSFIGQTVLDIIRAIAADNGLIATVDAALGAKIIPALGSGAKSDAALLRALGKRFDAVATVKAGELIFGPIGNGAAPHGESLPGHIIARSQTVDVDYSRIDQNDRSGVSASWHDKSTGKRKTVKAAAGRTGPDGTPPQGKAKRLRKVYASEAAAKQAADAENSRLARTKAKCTIKLAYGRPDIFPQRPITLAGFKPEIDAARWIVSECSHNMDGSGGLQSSLTLEATG